MLIILLFWSSTPSPQRENDTYSTATDNTWLAEANTDGPANYSLFITHGSVMT